MFNLFDLIPMNFFNIFVGANRVIYADILFILFAKMKSMNSYTMYKEEFIDIIENYLISNAIEIEELDIESKNPRTTATAIFRKLKELGWIDVEYDAVQQQLVNFEDYAISVLNNLLELSKDSTFELSSKVYSMYMNLKNIDLERGYLTVYTVYKQARDLIDKLKSLNSNIRKYIKKMIQLDQKDEVQYLNCVLNQLFSDYKEKIIDKAYYYMKTNDNPRKYKQAIESICERLKYDEASSRELINQIMTKDELDADEALNKLEEMLKFIEGSFDEAIDLMQIIDEKNAKYINVAIDKIKIILNHNTDIEGHLLHILKNFDLLQPEDINSHFFDRRNIMHSSLYTIKMRKKEIEPQELKQKNINYMKDHSLSILKENVKYCKRNIQKYVMQKLEKKDSLTIEDFNISLKEEFIKLLLIMIYESDKSSNYRVIWDKEEMKAYGYTTRQFIIERKK